MRLLLDTHIALWAMTESPRLPGRARSLISSADAALLVSVVSLWEIGIKQGKGLSDFRADPGLVRSDLLQNGYTELDISGRHVLTVASMPPIHKDPFDRILIAQAMIEGILLLTANPVIARYPGPIRKV